MTCATEVSPQLDGGGEWGITCLNTHSLGSGWTDLQVAGGQGPHSPYLGTCR